MVSSFCAEAVGGINFYELGYIIIAAINLLCIFLCCAFHWRSARQVRNLQKRLAHAQYNNMGKNGNDGILTLHSQPPNSNVGSYNPNSHNADFSEISAVSMIAATPTGKVPPRMLPPGSATPPMTARGPQPPPSQTPRSMKGPPPPPPPAPVNDTAQHFFSISVPGFEDNFLLRLRTTSKLDRLLETLPSKQGCESTLWVNGSPIDLKKSGFEMGFPTGVNSVIQLELRYNQLLGMPGTRSPSVTLLESHTITDQSSHHRGGGGGVMNTRNVNRNGPPSSTEEGGLYRPSKGVIVRNHANMSSGNNGMLLPWCENDEACDEINIPSHYRRFRHTCRIDNCENLSNPDHVRYFEHSVGGEGGRKHPRSPMLSPSTSSTAPLALSPRRDRPVCPKNGFCPDVNEDWHQQQWLHTCALFPCPAIYDDDHTMRFLHNDEHRLPAPPLCPSIVRGGACLSLADESHCNAYRHICHIVPCKAAGNAVHLRLFLHE